MEKSSWDLLKKSGIKKNQQALEYFFSGIQILPILSAEASLH